MGKKIKTFAKVLMILGVVSSIAIVFFGLRQYGDNQVYISLTSIGQNTNPDYLLKANQGYQGIYMAVCGGIGIIGCLFGLLPLYWFGCLFHRVESMKEQIEYLVSVSSKQEIEMLKK